MFGSRAVALPSTEQIVVFFMIGLIDLKNNNNNK